MKSITSMPFRGYYSWWKSNRPSGFYNKAVSSGLCHCGTDILNDSACRHSARNAAGALQGLSVV